MELSKNIEYCHQQILLFYDFHVDVELHFVSKKIFHFLMICMLVQDYTRLAKNIPSPFPFESRPKDGNHSFQFSGFTKVKNLYITGHSDGAINFWDLSCPFPIPLLSLKQQVSFMIPLKCLCSRGFKKKKWKNSTLEFS